MTKYLTEKDKWKLTLEGLLEAGYRQEAENYIEKYNQRWKQ